MISSVSCGAPGSSLSMTLRTFPSSCMRCDLLCRRPAVSMMTTSAPRACLLAQHGGQTLHAADVFVANALFEAVDDRRGQLRAHVGAEETFFEAFDGVASHRQIGGDGVLHLFDDLGVSHEKTAF